MPFSYTSLYQQLDTHLHNLNSQQALVQNDPRMAIFSNYWIDERIPNNTNIFASYNPSCWAAHLNLQCIAWHDTSGVGFPSWPDYGSTFGNSVAITRRHCITSEHGRDFAGTNLVWLKRSGEHVIRYAVDNIASISFNGIFDPAQDAGQFRVIYLDADLPDELVCQVAIQSDVPYNDGSGRVPPIPQPMQGMPLLYANRNKLAVIAGTFSFGDTGFQLRSVPASLGQAASDFPMRDIEGRLFLSSAFGDSGSPFFLMVNNSDLYYFGNMWHVGDQMVAAFPTYAKIVEACQILNSRHADAAGVQHYVPNVIYGATRPPRPGFFRPPPSGPLG